MAKEQFVTMHGNDYQTPQWLFDALNKEFNFTVDLAWYAPDELVKCTSCRGSGKAKDMTWW